MRIIGIDPGIKGGVAVVCPKLKLGDAGAGVVAMPIRICEHHRKNLIDVTMLHSDIESFCGEYIFIEKQHAFHGQGVTSTFTNAMNYGLILGCFFDQWPHNRLEPRIVTAKAWQKEFGISGKKGCTKKQSIAIAKELFPDVSLRRTPRCTTDSDGMSDALLIAEYGRRLLAKEK